MVTLDLIFINSYLNIEELTHENLPVNGGWSLWTGWGECDPRCGIGLRFRHRDCDNPAPSANGQQCKGDSKDIAICNNDCTGI